MMGHHPGGAHAAVDPAASASSPWSGEGAGGDLSRQAGRDDIGRTAGASDTRDSGHGLLDDSGRDDQDVEDADDVDDGDFDTDDGGGSDE
jgi:hypothetical protein